MSVEYRVKNIILARLGGYKNANDIPSYASLVVDLGADSIDLMEIGMALEYKFDLDISVEDAEKLKTVEDIINHIEKQ